MLLYWAQVFPVDSASAASAASVRMDLVSWGGALIGAWLFVHGFFWVMDLVHAREDRRRNEAQSTWVQQGENLRRFNNRFDERWK